MPIIFEECNICKPKPGMPRLCYNCMSERRLVGLIEEEGASLFLDYYDDDEYNKPKK